MFAEGILEQILAEMLCEMLYRKSKEEKKTGDCFEVAPSRINVTHFETTKASFVHVTFRLMHQLSGGLGHGQLKWMAWGCSLLKFIYPTWRILNDGTVEWGISYEGSFKHYTMGLRPVILNWGDYSLMKKWLLSCSSSICRFRYIVQSLLCVSETCKTTHNASKDKWCD